MSKRPVSLMHLRQKIGTGRAPGTAIDVFHATMVALIRQYVKHELTISCYASSHGSRQAKRGAVVQLDPEKLDAQLRQLLAGESGAEIGRQINETRQVVNSWLNGSSTPSVSKLVKLLDKAGYQLLVVPKKTTPVERHAERALDTADDLRSRVWELEEKTRGLTDLPDRVSELERVLSSSDSTAEEA